MTNFYWKIESELPELIETGICNAIVFKGYGFFLTGDTKRITIRLGGEIHEDLTINEPRHDVFIAHAMLDKKGYSQISGFWGVLPIPWSLGGQTLDLVLEAEENGGGIFKTVIGSIQIERRVSIKKAYFNAQNNDSSSVAICMATYNPEIDPFKRQIKSIIDQSYKNWICIINDDGSTKEKYAAIQKICGSDKRFFVFQNKKNMGFYRNFETVLKRVPDNVDFVAMADQDDYWYPDKIERCVNHFDPQTQLVYSDMRIVSDTGDVMSDTYWVGRKNNFKDFEVILLANTVTGAASVFRNSLLEKILPFPKKIGDAFHDNWIALTALMVGKIGYIDQPLYDYIQYSGHVIGHCDFDSLTVKGRFMRLREYTSIYTRVIGRKIISSNFDLRTLKLNLRIVRDYFIGQIRKNYRLLQAVYQHEYRRLQLFSRILKLRSGQEVTSNQLAINLFSSKDSTISQLMQAHFRISRNRHTTNDAEIRMMLSYVAYRINEKIAGLLRWRNVKRNNRQVRGVELELQLNTRFLENKIAPLKIRPDPSKSRRVNILIPTINPNLLFGGYIGKLNLAKQFTACGYDVRIIIVDECDSVPIKLNGPLPSASPMAAMFSKTDFQYCYDRKNTVVMHPDDIVVASTWWTAHIANDATKHLSQNHFLYFIQEYEPFTFAMGSYYALAKESYRFPHYPLFSSNLLKEYFVEKRLGYFRKNEDNKQSKAAFFENAILSFEVERAALEARPYKRLLFYARPEPHASRNMFETGMLALRKAIAANVFDDSWEFWAAGTACGEISLGNNKKLKMIGKLDLDAYQKTLPEFDLGMSLMYTPHPSLVPIEMAAAGMVVITTNCMNKTADKMKAISSNIIGVEATVDAVVSGLANGAAKTDDIDNRIDGTDVNWSSSWEESLPQSLIHKMVNWFDA